MIWAGRPSTDAIIYHCIYTKTLSSHWHEYNINIALIKTVINFPKISDVRKRQRSINSELADKWERSKNIGTGQLNLISSLENTCFFPNYRIKFKEIAQLSDNIWPVSGKMAYFSQKKETATIVYFPDSLARFLILPKSLGHIKIAHKRLRIKNCL